MANVCHDGKPERGTYKVQARDEFWSVDVSTRIPQPDRRWLLRPLAFGALTRTQHKRKVSMVKSEGNSRGTEGVQEAWQGAGLKIIVCLAGPCTGLSSTDLPVVRDPRPASQGPKFLELSILQSQPRWLVLGVCKMPWLAQKTSYHRFVATCRSCGF